MRNIQKPLGIMVFSALLLAGSVLVTEAKTKKVFAQEATSTPTVVNLEPTKWEALEILGRGKLEKGMVIDATYSEEELNGFIEGALASKNVSWFLDQASIKINKGNAEFSGRMLKPIKGWLVVNTSVLVENEKLVIKINSARYGIFRVPASFVERVGNFILKKKAMTEWFNVPNARFEDITFSPGSVHVRVVGE
ncbi:MAG: hypothetical protein LiPW41_276 [Parcubacteria group bacterium LiPW_41]|nr:MAG: hypothetical protein LiPW41_276 [Parcubacteria group bacterium LiPW_41]